MEQIAQEWELVRRYRPELNWPPFYEIGSYVARNLRVRLIQNRMRSTKMVTTEMVTTETSPVGWTTPDSGGWRYSLGCTKDALRRAHRAQFLPTESDLSEVMKGTLTVEGLCARLAARRKALPSMAEHIRWIEMQAKSRGFVLPRGLKGQRNRSVSWRWVELLDIAKHVATRNNPLRKLTAPERKMKTLATKAAKNCLPRYVAALAEIRTMPGFTQMHAPEHIAHHRRVILGSWTPKTNW